MVVNEVVMGQIVVVEQLHEDTVVCDERAGAKRVAESLDRHCVVVEA